jgi:hypothetical protein
MIAVGGAGAALWAWLPGAPGDAQGILLFGLGLGLLLRFTRIDTPMGAPGAMTCDRIVLLAFLVRAAFAFVDRRYALIPDLYTSDVAYYDGLAWAIASAWRAGVHPEIALPPNVAVHSSLGAVVYVLLGRTPLGLGMLAAMLGALSIGHVYRAARGIVGAERGTLAALALALWPSHVLWTSQYFREPWVFYFVALALHASVRWRTSNALADWVTTAACVVLVTVFRTGTGLVAVGALAAATLWALAVPRSRPVTLVRPALAVVAFAGGVAAIMKWAAAALPEGSILGYVALTRQKLATGGSAIHPGWAVRSWGEAIVYAPFAVITFLLAPLPWHARNVPQLGAALENLMLLAMIVLAGARLSQFRTLAWNTALFTAAFGALGILAFGLVEGNAGTAFRHKMQFLPALLIVLAAAWPAARREALPDAMRRSTRGQRQPR